MTRDEDDGQDVGGLRQHFLQFQAARPGNCTSSTRQPASVRCSRSRNAAADS
jgi:hypothetical protein